MVIKSIIQAKNLKGKRVLLRSDFNVPIKNGKITDDYKITQGLATIKYLLSKHSKIIIITHLGEPQPEANLKYFTVQPLAAALTNALGKKVKFVADTIGLKAGTNISRMKNGELILLENLRFNPGELKNDKKFAKQLAALADIYVNDAFAVSHRNHASLSAVKNYLPAFAGLLLAKEVTHLSRILAALKFPPKSP
jgi:3-phosphoglycerate kinase